MQDCQSVHTPQAFKHFIMLQPPTSMYFIRISCIDQQEIIQILNLKENYLYNLGFFLQKKIQIIILLL